MNPERRKVVPWPVKLAERTQQAVSYSSELVSASMLIMIGVFIGTLMGLAIAFTQTSQYEQAAARALSIMETLKDHHFMERH